jgi:hypothetical protein
MLKLDRPSCGDDGRGEQGSDVRDATGEHARRRERATRSRSATRGRDAGTRAGRRSAAAGAAADPKHVRQHADWPERRHERRELTADATDLCAELATSGAVVHVAPRAAARPDAAIVGDDQFLADFVACRVAGLERLRESDPGAYEQRLDSWDRDPEGIGDIGVCHPAELAHQERRALLLGQPPDILDQPPERLPLLGLDRRIVDRRAQEPEHFGRRGRRAPELIDAAVVGDPVQPRP